MTYLRVDANRADPDAPILVFRELDAHRLEVRKVEVYRNGRSAYASAADSAGGCSLSPDAVLQPTAVDITREQFEDAWERATAFVP